MSAVNGSAPAPQSPAWYDLQYNSRGRIPEHPEILRFWAESSEAAHRRPGWRRDLAYGDGEREQLDILGPLRPGAPVLVYIHGGYWRALDKRSHAFVAPPLVDAGAMVVMLGYALCPAVGIGQIVAQVERALGWVHRHASEHGGDPDCIVVAGHSAGGHLAAMALACDWPASAPDLPPDLVKASLAISGLYELEPVRRTPFLADLGLDAASARRLSPAARPAPRHGRLLTVVGAEESEEFHRQAGEIARAWGPVVAGQDVIAGRHHMNVLHELARPEATVHRRALELLGL